MAPRLGWLSWNSNEGGKKHPALIYTACGGPRCVPGPEQRESVINLYKSI